eukprot:1176964-Prorocentrum_minimum.AAC.7
MPQYSMPGFSPARGAASAPSPKLQVAEQYSMARSVQYSMPGFFPARGAATAPFPGLQVAEQYSVAQYSTAQYDTVQTSATAADT